MTLSELQQIRYLQQAVTQMEQDLEKLKSASYIGGGRNDGMPRGSDRRDKVGDRAIETADLERELEKLIQECAEQQRRALIFLRSIEDARARLGIYYKYVCGLTWDQAAEKLGQTETADALRMAARRYIEAERRQEET